MAAKKETQFDTWMPLYVGDYLRKTMGLTVEQHGAYLLLIMACWTEGGRLPNDTSQLAAFARMAAPQWARAEPILRKYFAVTPEHWIHERVLEELTKAKEMVAKKKKAGTAAAAARWGMDASAH
jgi:uncharacterized protein YdaU (DUF1376 family)